MNIDDLTRQLMVLVDDYSKNRDISDGDASIESRANLVGFFVEALQSRGHEDYKRGWDNGMREGMLKQKGLNEIEELRAHLVCIIGSIKSSPEDAQKALAAQAVIELTYSGYTPPKPFDAIPRDRRVILLRTKLAPEMNELKNMAGDLIQ